MLKARNEFNYTETSYYSKNLDDDGNPFQVLLDSSVWDRSRFLGTDEKASYIFYTKLENDSVIGCNFFNIATNHLTRIPRQLSFQKGPSKVPYSRRLEIVKWKDFQGKELQGILCKPDNFSPMKKYPIIVNFYTRLATRREFWTSSNVEYLLANGYLVFAPDIHYAVGEIGKSVYNAVVSGAQYLKKLPFVDDKRMGIDGFSFGAYEVNLLITHPNLFAAAVSGCGVSNLISQYGRVEESFGFTGSAFVETSQHAMGTTLWERPDLYLKNSPIFYADKVTTPLLIISSKGHNVHRVKHDNKAIPHFEV